MSTTKDKNLMTSAKLKRKLKSISTDKTEVKNSLLDIVEKFQCLDQIAKSIGLVKEKFSFANRVSWESVLSQLGNRAENSEAAEEIKLNEISDVVSQSTVQLENELIPKLQKWRNNWMLEVILIEIVLFGLLSLVVAGVTHLQGFWSMSSVTAPFQTFLYERPAFSLIIGILLFISFIMMHFNIRDFVAEQYVKKLTKESTEFDFAGAFLKNTRIQHSIFRPDIIGLGWLSRKCLLKKSNAVES